MADFSVSSEAIRRAAQQLARVVDQVEPRPAAMAVSQGALGSSEVYSALYAANFKQTKAAKKAADDIEAVANLMMVAADAVDEQDQQLADGMNG